MEVVAPPVPVRRFRVLRLELPLVVEPREAFLAHGRIGQVGKRLGVPSLLRCRQLASFPVALEVPSNGALREVRVQSGSVAIEGSAVGLPHGWGYLRGTRVPLWGTCEYSA